MIYTGIPICSVCKVKANLHGKKCKKGKGLRSSIMRRQATQKCVL